jgi:hypothetical protein
MIRVEIQVQDGKVTLSVGGQSYTKAAENAAEDAVVQQAFVGQAPDGGKKGGDPANEDIFGGGGAGSGPLVIGPVVICGSVAENSSGDSQGGDPANEDIFGGGSGAGSVPLVIGPIVICARGRSAAASTTTSQTISLKPK